MEKPHSRPSMGYMNGFYAFGISKAQSTFMRLKNEVLRPFIYKFVIVYWDDILAYSYDEASYAEQLFMSFIVWGK